MPSERRYIITLTCPDTTGIVARIAGFLADAGGWIVEAGYHSDVDSGWFFTRQVVRADSCRSMSTSCGDGSPRSPRSWAPLTDPATTRPPRTPRAGR